MKKTIIILFLFILMIPNVYADYGINNYYVDAKLLNNGDLHIKEYFELNGSFNGYEREIYYKNSYYTIADSLDILGYSNIYDGSDINLIDIKAVDFNRDFDFNNVNGKSFKRVNNAHKGDYGVYEINNYNNGYGYKIFLPSKYNKAFYIEYIIKDMAVVHDDVGELWFKIFDNANFKESIAYFEINIYFENNDDLKVWAHGPLNGEVKNIDNNRLYAYVDNLRAGRDLSFRAVFNKNIISNSNKKSNIDALDKIISYETDSANEANYERLLKIEQTKKAFENDLIECESNPDEYCYGSLLKKLKDINDDAFTNKHIERLNKIRDEFFEKDILECEEYPNRYCYKELIENIELIDNEEFTKLYQDRLNIIKNEYIEKEKEYIEYQIYEIKVRPRYKSYIELKEDIDKLEVDNKEEYYKELSIIEDIVKMYEEKRSNNYILTNIIIVLICVGICYYIKYYYTKKDVKFDLKYYREIPIYSPSTISYLLNENISNESFSSELLLMIDKGTITYSKDDKHEDNYYLEYNKDKTKDKLSIKEEKIIKIIFNNKTKISLKDFKDNLKNVSNKTIYDNWNDYKRLAKNDAKSKNFIVEKVKNVISKNNKFILLLLFSFLIYLLSPFLGIFVFIVGLITNKFINLNKEHITKEICKILLLFIAFITIILMIVYLVEVHFCRNTFIAGIITLIMILVCYSYISKQVVRSDKGKEEYSKIIAFKNFLKDFSTFDSKDLPEVKLWNKYLIYAVVLGEAARLSKTMEMKLNELNIETPLINYTVFDGVRNIDRIVNSKASKYAPVRNTGGRGRSGGSSGSSGSSFGSFSSGSGGGFSSSSSGGGGGGGGSRF